MNDVYTYKIGDNLYCNLTNRCTNRCTFCVRDQSAEYEGYPLWLSREPSAEELIAEIGDPTRYHEVVFCGYGEPTYRMDVIERVASYVHEKGGKTRINTNGHGNVINGRDVTAALKIVDTVNVSLNAPDEESYCKVCRPHVEHALEEVLSFARLCKEHGVNALFSVVDCIGEQAVARCRALAEKVGIPLRVREMIGSM